MQLFFPASVIARVSGTCSKSVHRKARREGWLLRKNGNRVEIAPPSPLQRRCKAMAERMQLIDDRTLLRELARAAAVLAVVMRLRVHPALGIEQNLKAVSYDFREILEISPLTLRRYYRAVEQHGLAGLKDRRPGRSGRKRKAVCS